MENKIFKNIKSENGQAALIMVLIVMMLLLFIGLFLTEIVLKQIKTTENAERFTQAYFLADTGTEKILYDFKEGIKTSADLPFTETIAGLGSYTVIETTVAPANLTIKITGTHKNTARAIEISW